MLMVETNDPRAEMSSKFTDLTCGASGDEAPHVKYRGDVGELGNIFKLWSFVPEGAVEYRHREFIRSTQLLVPPKEEPSQ
jgi:hypothetical protein